MRVLLVDHHRLFADAIRPVLQSNGMEVFVAFSGAEAYAVADRAVPDVAIVNVALPDAEGFEVGRRILKQHPTTRVLALTQRSDSRVLAEASQAGFRGYLAKDTSISQFVSSIRGSLNGHVVAPLEVVAPPAPAKPSREDGASLLAKHLTAREREILGLLVAGATTEQIVSRLSVSSNTVRTHIQSILTKLQVHSRLEAASFAVRYGIVKVPRPQAVANVPSEADSPIPLDPRGARRPLWRQAQAGAGLRRASQG